MRAPGICKKGSVTLLQENQVFLSPCRLMKKAFQLWKNLQIFKIHQAPPSHGSETIAEIY